MRYISFDVEKDVKSYARIYEAMIVKPGGYANNEQRTLVKILDKLESIGSVDPERAGTVVFFQLSKSGVLAFEDAEYNLLLSAYKAINWYGTIVREAVAAQDLIEAASEKAPDAA